MASDQDVFLLKVSRFCCTKSYVSFLLSHLSIHIEKVVRKLQRLTLEHNNLDPLPEQLNILRTILFIFSLEFNVFLTCGSLLPPRDAYNNILKLIELMNENYNISDDIPSAEDAPP